MYQGYLCCIALYFVSISVYQGYLWAVSSILLTCITSLIHLQYFTVSSILLHCISSLIHLKYFVFQYFSVSRLFMGSVFYSVNLYFLFDSFTVLCISVFQCIKAIYGQCQAELKGATNSSTLRQQTLCIFKSVFP